MKIFIVFIIALFVFIFNFRGCGAKVHRVVELTTIDGFKDTIEHTSRLTPKLVNGVLYICEGRPLLLSEPVEYPYVNSFRYLQLDTIK